MERQPRHTEKPNKGEEDAATSDFDAGDEDTDATVWKSLTRRLLRVSTQSWTVSVE